MTDNAQPEHPEVSPPELSTRVELMKQLLAVEDQIRALPADRFADRSELSNHRDQIKAAIQNIDALTSDELMADWEGQAGDRYVEFIPLIPPVSGSGSGSG